jgi:DNA-binding MurR/RpiR family transcriptional regulator
MERTAIGLRIKTIFDDLTPKEKIIAEYILHNPEKIVNSNIATLSEELNIAGSTLFKFVKKIGFEGFKDFQLALVCQINEELYSIVHEDVSLEDSPFSIAQKVMRSDIRTLQDTSLLLNEKAITTASDMIIKSKKLCFFGLGGSEIVAMDAYHKFLRTPVNVLHSTDFHLQLMEASLLTPNDCALLISHSGKTKDMLRIAEVLMEAQVPMIVLTGSPSSPLSKLAAVTLVYTSNEINYRSESLSSRIAQLALIDSLYVITMFQTKEQNEVNLQKIRRTISKGRT